MKQVRYMIEVVLI